MGLLNYLCPSCIDTQLRGESKEEVVRSMASMAGRAIPGLDVEGLVRVLMEREALGTTGIGGGVAIPHGKIPGIDRPRLFFFRSPSGVPFDAIDHRPVRVIFLLLAPEGHASLYLQVLARVSRLLKVDGAVERLAQVEEWEGLEEAVQELEAVGGG